MAFLEKAYRLGVVPIEATTATIDCVCVAFSTFELPYLPHLSRASLAILSIVPVLLGPCAWPGPKAHGTYNHSDSHGAVQFP
jgi:hypothetical protein